jgi:serine/threonine-protein kinase RsbW
MTQGSLTLEVTNKPSELETLGARLETFCQALDLPPKIVFQLKFAIEEVFVNIISYGFRDKKEHRIRITMNHEDGVVVMRIEDDGLPFNPLETEAPDVACPIEDRKVGGLGLHLTKQLMSEIEYERLGGKNVLTVRKNLKEG